MPENPVPPAAPAPTPGAGAPAPAPAAPVAVPGVAILTLEEFKRVHLRTAQVLEAQPHPKADRLMILKIQVGEKAKQIVAGIRQYYAPEQLVGRTIVVVNNLEPAKLRGETSEGMLLAVRLPEGGLRLLTTDGPAPSGLEVS
jgi:methionine--tRNA ligase beta chain